MGLTVADHAPGCDVMPSTRNGAPATQLERKVSNALSHPGMGGARLSVSEDTGLLRVGDASKRVRYVPAKTTTVVKRIKPPTDSDDEQARTCRPTVIGLPHLRDEADSTSTRRALIKHTSTAHRAD